jgi:hypothetical protein
MAKAAPAESGSNPDVNAQIEGAVRKHLSRRGDLDMSAMDMGIEAVEVNGDEADATVSFRVKGTPEAAMSMKYHLIRQAGAWVVQPNAAAGHGATPPPPRGLPPGHPPAGGQQPAQPLPPGHPPVAQ